MRVERGLAPLPLRAPAPRWSARARAAWSARRSASRPTTPATSRCATSSSHRYEARMTRETQVFDDMVPVLAWLASARPAVGHRHQQGDPLRRAARRRARPCATRAATLVCGDTVAHSKPHPAPLLEAARRLGAGRRRAASTSATTCATSTPAAPRRWSPSSPRWGYLGDGDAPASLGRRPPDRAAGRAAGAVGGARLSRRQVLAERVRGRSRRAGGRRRARGRPVGSDQLHGPGRDAQLGAEMRELASMSFRIISCCRSMCTGVARVLHVIHEL